MEKGADEIIIKNKGQSKEKYLLINIIIINKISYTYMINRFDQWMINFIFCIVNF